MLVKWIILATLLLVGCNSIGPKQMRCDKYHYNEAYQDTEKQELLLNIVRIKYLEPISFLKVTSITASYNLNPRIAGKFGVGFEDHSAFRRFSVMPSISYMDEPTVAYAPVTSADFINELLTPTELMNMSYLLYGGIHDHNLLFRLVISCIQGIDNASAISDAKIISPPIYRDFYHLLSLLDQLVSTNSAKMVVEELNDSKTIAIRFAKNCVQSPNAIEMKQMLHVPLCSDIIILTSTLPSKGNIIHIETRSVLGIMNYLAHGVHVPPCDALTHRSYDYYYPNGAPFNWAPLMNGLMAIYSCDEEPCNAFVKVRLHDHWFYIRDSDSDSKFTFGFLHDLIILTAGKEFSGGPAPMLTLPVRAR